MAFGSIGGFGTNQSKSSNQSSLVLTTNASVAAYTLAVIIVAVDNNATTDQDESAVTGVVDSAGNIWTKGVEWTNGQGGAQSGTTCSLWYCNMPAALGSGGTVTISFSNNTSRDASAVISHNFSAGTGKMAEVEGTPGHLSNDGEDPGSLDVTTSNIACLRIRGISGETNSTTGLTVTNGWTEITKTQTSGTPAAGNQAARGEFIISTGTGSASDPSFASVDCSSVYIAFKEVDIPAFSVEDNFNRADENPIAGNWSSDGTYGFSSLKIASNVLATDGGPRAAIWKEGYPQADQWAEITLGALATYGSQAPLVRAGIGTSGTRHCYLFTCYRDEGGLHGRFGKYVNGSYTVLKDYTGTVFAQGDTCKLEVVGSTLTVYRNGSPVDSTTDTSLTGGKPGVLVDEAGATVTLFKAGNVLVTIEATLDATESGSDTADFAAEAVVSATLDATEPASGILYATVLVQDFIGVELDATESGSDTAAVTVDNIVSLDLDATESGSDTADFSLAFPNVAELEATESGSDTADFYLAYPRSATLDATESGSDTADFAAEVPVSLTAPLVESGSDTLAATLTNAVSATLATTDGADTASMAVEVPVSVNLAGVESGPDIASLVSEVPVSSELAATESGSDTMDFSITSQFSATLAGIESGPDTLAITLTNAVSATLDATEGADTASITVEVPVSSALAATESGSDTMAGVLAFPAVATLDATESGSDTLAGAITNEVSLSLAATESGPDTMAVSVAGANSATLDATESGSDTMAVALENAVSATLGATELGSDTMTGLAIHAGTSLITLDATESGPDTMDFLLGLGNTAVLASSETGKDTLAFSLELGIQITLTAAETGSDTMVASLTLPNSLALDATESGSDTMHFSIISMEDSGGDLAMMGVG